MINFELRDTTDLIFGIDAEDRCAQLVKDFGGTRVLVHHAGEPFVMGLVEKTLKILRDAGLYAMDLGGVVPNPRVSLANEGAALCKREKIDFVLAIGGGSVIDSAKLISLAAGYDGDAWDYCIGKAVDHRPLPLGVISTFAGTGSEMTMGCVINKEDERAKRGLEHSWLHPKFAILNPKLTLTIPPFQTASGVADITSHLLENFFSPTQDSDLPNNLHIGALKTVLQHGANIAAHPDDLHSRSELMLLAPMAIYGILKVGRSGDWACHSLEHKLSGEWDIAHGAGLAIITPVWMRYVYKNHIDKFVSLAVDVFGLENDAENPEQTALKGIEAMEHFFFDVMKLPRKLSGLGIKDVADETLHALAKKNYIYGNSTIGGMALLKEEDCYEIYKQCL